MDERERLDRKKELLLLKKRLRKAARIICIMLLIFMLCRACSKPYNNLEKTPEDRWVSKDPDIYFSLLDEEKGTNYGQMVIDGEVIEIEPNFDFGAGVYFYYYERDLEAVHPEGMLFCGQCSYTKNELIVKVTPEQDLEGLFGGEPIRIKFHREKAAEGKQAEEQ